MITRKKADTGLESVIVVGIFIVILLLVFMLPVKGTIFGQNVELPIIGWIGLAAFAILALVVFVIGLIKK